MCQHACYDQSAYPGTALSSHSVSTRSISVTVLSVLWLFTPKCPACLATHLLLAVGIGISLTAAIHLRLFVVMFYIGLLLLFLALRLATRWHEVWQRAHECHI